MTRARTGGHQSLDGSSGSIFGVRCDLRAGVVRRAVTTVLRAIGRHSDRHIGRLRRRARGFTWLSPSETAASPSTAAEFMQECEVRDPTCERCFASRGWIKLSPRMAGWGRHDLEAEIAHECGHAVALQAQVLARGRDSVLAAELAADHLAFRWGFEEQIRRRAPKRAGHHHPGLPGECFQREDCWVTITKQHTVKPCRHRLAADGAHPAIRARA